VISCYEKFEEEEGDAWEYENCGTQKNGSFMVAGGGMMNGNAYATVEKQNDRYYYCEYGPHPSRECIGNTIKWEQERQDKLGNFDVSWE
jgi:hypothetical protein